MLIICCLCIIHFVTSKILKADNSGMYTEKLNEAGILDIINANKQVFEPFGDHVDSALITICVLT